MLARRIDHDDFSEIESWFKARNMAMPHKSFFSKYGFMVSGVAAGFIYFTTSKVAIIDMYIANPNVESQTRDMAIDVITDELIRMAKFRKCHVIKCDTQNENVAKRAKKFGFTSTGFFESFKLSL